MDHSFNGVGPELRGRRSNRLNYVPANLSQQQTGVGVRISKWEVGL
jgi:hypothetical protein